jgi:hypothetical protein
MRVGAQHGAVMAPGPSIRSVDNPMTSQINDNNTTVIIRIDSTQTLTSQVHALRTQFPWPEPLHMCPWARRWTWSEQRAPVGHQPD